MRLSRILLSSVFLLTVLSLSVRTYQTIAQENTTTDTVRQAVDSATPVSPPRPTVTIVTLEIDGAITAVTEMRISDAIEYAEDEDAELLVILLDTPGGFMPATYTICKNILNSRIPVCTYIAPSGARAGSAGVYITYASHVTAMAPSTNIGAAHPVSGGGEIADSVMNEKVTNDAVAQIMAAAERHGRNAEWAEQAVRESVSIPNSKALEIHVVDLVAEDLEDLLDQLDGRSVKMSWGDKVLSTAKRKIDPQEETFVHRFLSVITSPDVVFILFSIGGLGIVLELYHPGAIFPGVVGAVSLILAFYASSVLPINYAGVALILLAIVLFILELKIASAGMLTVGGIVSLFLGGMMLIDSAEPVLQVSLGVLLVVAIFVGVIAGVAAYLVLKAHKRKVTSGDENLIGKRGELRANGMLYVEGALWKTDAGTSLEPGSKVEVIGVEGLTLKVRKISE